MRCERAKPSGASEDGEAAAFDDVRATRVRIKIPAESAARGAVRIPTMPVQRCELSRQDRVIVRAMIVNMRDICIAGP